MSARKRRFSSSKVLKSGFERHRRSAARADSRVEAAPQSKTVAQAALTPDHDPKLPQCAEQAVKLLLLSAQSSKRGRATWCPGKDGQRYSNPNGLSPGEGESGTFDRKQLFSALPSPRKSAGPNEQPRAPPVLQSPFARSSVHYRQREDEQDEENSASGSESKKNLIRGRVLTLMYASHGFAKPQVKII